MDTWGGPVGVRERCRKADPMPGGPPAWAPPFISPRVVQMGQMVMRGGFGCTWGHTDGSPCSKDGLILSCLLTGGGSQMPLLHPRPLPGQTGQANPVGCKGRGEAEPRENDGGEQWEG